MPEVDVGREIDAVHQRLQLFSHQELSAQTDPLMLIAALGYELVRLIHVHSQKTDLEQFSNRFIRLIRRYVVRLHRELR
jgi:hypothetical protein